MQAIMLYIVSIQYILSTGITISGITSLIGYSARDEGYSKQFGVKVLACNSTLVKIRGC